MSLHISIDCFRISIDCFCLSGIKNWMILIISVNLRNWDNFCSLLAFGISQKRKLILSLRRLSRLISLPRKNVKPILVQALHQMLAYFSHSG